MAAAGESKAEGKEGDGAPALTSLTAAEPLVLRPEDVADGLSQLQRTVDGTGFAYAKLNLAGRAATSFGTALSGMKHIRYLDASHNALTDPRPVAMGMPSLLAAHLAHNSLVTTADFSGSPHLQVLNVSHNKLVSFAPREPPPPPPSLEALERLRRTARKEARKLAKAASRSSAARRSSKARSRDEGDLEGEDLEEPPSEEALLAQLLAAATEDAAVAAREEAGGVGAALLDRFAAPGLLHLIAHGNPLASLEGLAEGGLPKLLRLEAASCAPLRSLSSLGALSSLRELIITDCPALSDLSGLHDLPALRVLVLDRCAVSSLRPLLTGRPLPAAPVREEEGEEEGSVDEEAAEAAAAEAAAADPDPEAVDESGGDGVHVGAWEEGEGGKWVPGPREEVVEEGGLESDDEDERATGAGQEEPEEEEEGEGKEAAAPTLPAGLAAPAAHPRATTATGVHPLGRLRVLSLAGNPLEGLGEVNRLRYLRGLASVNLRDTPLSDGLGEEELVTELLIRLGGKRGQRIRLAAQLAHDAAASAALAHPGRSAAEAGDTEASLEASAAANVLARVNGVDVSGDAVLAARAERKARVAAWVGEWERRAGERAEAAAAARLAAEEEEGEEEA